jgi:uncharacterized membrane protein YgcG
MAAQFLVDKEVSMAAMMLNMGARGLLELGFDGRTICSVKATGAGAAPTELEAVMLEKLGKKVVAGRDLNKVVTEVALVANGNVKKDLLMNGFLEKDQKLARRSHAVFTGFAVSVLWACAHAVLLAVAELESIAIASAAFEITAAMTIALVPSRDTAKGLTLPAVALIVGLAGRSAAAVANMPWPKAEVAAGTVLVIAIVAAVVVALSFTGRPPIVLASWFVGLVLSVPFNKGIDFEMAIGCSAVLLSTLATRLWSCVDTVLTDAGQEAKTAVLGYHLHAMKKAFEGNREVDEAGYFAEKVFATTFGCLPPATNGSSSESMFVYVYGGGSSGGGCDWSVANGWDVGSCDSGGGGGSW